MARRWSARFYQKLASPQAIAGTVIVFALFTVVICALILLQTRDDAVSRARDTSRNLVSVAEHDIERNFEIYGVALQMIVDRVNDPEVAKLPWSMRRDLVFDRATSKINIGAMVVLDAKGNVTMDAESETPPKVNFSERKYFAVHRDNPNVGLYISGPYPTRLHPGSHTLVLSRRISAPDGSFKGVALIGIDLQYFRKLFGSLSLGPNGLVALLNRDGTVTMRYPYSEDVIGTNVQDDDVMHRFNTEQEGCFWVDSKLDGVRRYHCFKSLADLPFIIIVGETEQHIYTQWKRRATMIGSLMALLIVGLFSLALALSLQLQRRMRAEADLSLLAKTDGLTGLSNRHMLDEILGREWRRARRTRNALSLLFVDLDWFKSYNDTYGHQAGDDALTAVARCISDHVHRPTDCAARYGGEEFIVVLPNTNAEGATAVAQKIRTAIDALRIPHTGSVHEHVTVSIGVSTLVPTAPREIGAVIKSADEALYRAKTTGRNRVVVAETPEVEVEEVAEV
ncbi:sensor domain-containing diguanylate cyclase [Pararobbsia silviterrae]|uniref:diguanylate cyclase n=1 Tax=Pararobbsia silviterrae TaxID=1792498 RepID=A0A494XJV4_9BURK|nr:GGDEF domain-containing protein [Pararobbsia silviterrae]